MKKIDELRDYLLENYVDGWGDLNLTGLDFSEFNGDVFLGNMKVKGNLNIDCLDVKGDLSQDSQEVGGNLWQGNQKVEGNLRQSSSEIKGDYYCIGIKVGGGIYTEDPVKLLKKITREELAEMGYEVVD